MDGNDSLCKLMIKCDSHDCRLSGASKITLSDILCGFSSELRHSFVYNCDLHCSFVCERDKTGPGTFLILGHIIVSQVFVCVCVVPLSISVSLPSQS